MNCNQLQLFNNYNKYYRSDAYRLCDEAWEEGYEAYKKFKFIDKDFVVHWEAGWFAAASNNNDWTEMERMCRQWENEEW